MSHLRRRVWYPLATFVLAFFGLASVYAAAAADLNSSADEIWLTNPLYSDDSGWWQGASLSSFNPAYTVVRDSQSGEINIYERGTDESLGRSAPFVDAAVDGILVGGDLVGAPPGLTHVGIAVQVIPDAFEMKEQIQAEEYDKAAKTGTKLFAKLGTSWAITKSGALICAKVGLVGGPKGAGAAGVGCGVLIFIGSSIYYMVLEPVIYSIVDDYFEPSCVSPLDDDFKGEFCTFVPLSCLTQSTTTALCMSRAHPDLFNPDSFFHVDPSTPNPGEGIPVRISPIDACSDPLAECQTQSDGRRWCALPQQTYQICDPVKLIDEKPFDYGGMIERAINDAIMKCKANVMAKYSSPAEQGGMAYVGALKLCETELHYRPYMPKPDTGTTVEPGRARIEPPDAVVLPSSPDVPRRDLHGDSDKIKVRGDLDVHVRVDGSVVTQARGDEQAVTRIGSTAPGTDDVGGTYVTDIQGDVLNEGGVIEINPLGRGCKIARNGQCCEKIDRGRCVVDIRKRSLDRACPKGYKRRGKYCYEYADYDHSLSLD